MNYLNSALIVTNNNPKPKNWIFDANQRFNILFAEKINSTDRNESVFVNRKQIKRILQRRKWREEFYSKNIILV